MARLIELEWEKARARLPADLSYPAVRQLRLAHLSGFTSAVRIVGQELAVGGADDALEFIRAVMAELDDEAVRGEPEGKA